ncbi:hypothetical protein KBD75_03950 [Candidatus Woesebacteria bacterium]|nr:hypothetical protein [Candidatus Woesebacteria bacterium]
MAGQELIEVTDQKDFGPDEVGFYRALIDEIAERETAAKSEPVVIEKVSTPTGASDAIGMYGSQ